MKSAPLHLPFLGLLFTFFFSGCTFVYHQLSSERDAVAASQLGNPHIAVFQFGDAQALKEILSDALSKYDVALAYMKKAAKLYEGMERVHHDRQIAQVEKQLNLVQAQVNSLIYLYPEEWKASLLKLEQDYGELQTLYMRVHKEMI